MELARRAKLAGYAGAKSVLYDLVRTLRSTPPRPVVRFEGLPGEFPQHDFAEVVVRFLKRDHAARALLWLALQVLALGRSDARA